MPLYNLSPGQYNQFVRIFNSLAGEGRRIGPNEIKAILARRGVSSNSDRVQAIIDSVSTEPRGITLQAFIDYVSSYESFRDIEGEFAEAFRIYDRSGSGQLSKDDIKYVLEKIGLRVNLDELMNEVDKNKDNFIQYDEFVELMRTKL